MTSLQDIIARLEAATGSDRELDRDICLLVGSYRSDLWEKHPDHSNLLRTKDAKLNDWVCAPCYTESIDAALRLVPEGKWWTVCSLPICATVGDVDCTIPPDRYQVGGPTPAIALCIAALRSRTDAKGEK